MLPLNIPERKLMEKRERERERALSATVAVSFTIVLFFFIVSHAPTEAPCMIFWFPIIAYI